MRQPLTVCADDVLDLRFSNTNSLFIVLQPKQTAPRRNYQTPIFAWSSRALSTRTAKDVISFTIEHDVGTVLIQAGYDTGFADFLMPGANRYYRSTFHFFVNPVICLGVYCDLAAQVSADLSPRPR
jgi:hypothetical protein